MKKVKAKSNKGKNRFLLILIVWMSICPGVWVSAGGPSSIDLITLIKVVVGSGILGLDIRTLPYFDIKNDLQFELQSCLNRLFH